MDRTVESILAEWREAVALREDVTFDPILEARIEKLRLEHAAAIEARRVEAEELARLGPVEA
jgi:hypothetical protein